MSTLEKLETKVKQIESRLDGIDFNMKSLMKSQEKDVHFLVKTFDKEFAEQARLNEEIGQKVENIFH